MYQGAMSGYNLGMFSKMNKQEKGTHINKNMSLNINQEMTQILKLVYKDFKAVVTSHSNHYINEYKMLL
jgi:hypothetical protein